MRVLLIVLLLLGCSNSETGHRSNAYWEQHHVRGIKMHMPSSFSDQEKAWIIEAIRFQCEEFERREGRQAPPPGLEQIWILDRRRGPPPRGQPLLSPGRQNHRANGANWSLEDGGLDAPSGQAYLYKGGSFEVPLLYHLMHHYSFFGPSGLATDFSHISGTWGGVDGNANTVIAVLRAQR